MCHSKKYELTELEALSRAIKVLKAKNEGDKYYIEIKRKERSYEQLKLYWGEWLPSILYFLLDTIQLNTIEELHVYLKEWYCMERNTDAFKRVVIGGKVRYICMFSINFEKASSLEMSDYMRFIEDNFYKIICIEEGINNLDDLILRYKDMMGWVLN